MVRSHLSVQRRRWEVTWEGEGKIVRPDRGRRREDGEAGEEGFIIC